MVVRKVRRVGETKITAEVEWVGVVIRFRVIIGFRIGLTKSFSQNRVSLESG